MPPKSRSSKSPLPAPATALTVGKADYSAILGIASSGKISKLSALDEVIKQSLMASSNPWNLNAFPQIAYNCVHHKWLNSFTYLLNHPKRPVDWQTKLFANKGMARVLATGSPEHLSLLFSLGVDPYRFVRYPLILQRLSKEALATSLQSPAGDGLVANTFERTLNTNRTSKPTIEYLSRLLTSLYSVQATTPLTSKVFGKLASLSLSGSASYSRLLTSLLENPLAHRFLPLMRTSTTDLDCPRWTIAAATAKLTVLRFRSFSTITNQSTRDVIKQGTTSQILVKEPVEQNAWAFLGNLLIGVTAWEDTTKNYGYGYYGYKKKATTDSFAAFLPGILAEFKPVINQNPVKFWAAVDNHLANLSIDRSNHFARGVLLAALVLNPDVHRLPGFHANASKFNQAFQAWFVHPFNKTKDSTDHGLLTSAYLEIVKQELALGQTPATLPATLAGFNTSVANARKVVAALTASNASHGLTWNQDWEDLFVALSNKLTKKDKSSTLPALEKWRMVHLLPESDPASKTSLRPHL